MDLYAAFHYLKVSDGIYKYGVERGSVDEPQQGAAGRLKLAQGNLGMDPYTAIPYSKVCDVECQYGLGVGSVD